MLVSSDVSLDSPASCGPVTHRCDTQWRAWWERKRREEATAQMSLSNTQWKEFKKREESNCLPHSVAWKWGQKDQCAWEEQRLPWITGVVWKVTSVASGTMHTTCVCVCVNMWTHNPNPQLWWLYKDLNLTLLTCLHTVPTLVTVTVPPPILHRHTRQTSLVSSGQEPLSFLSIGMWLNPHTHVCTHTHHCTQISKLQFLQRSNRSNEDCNILSYLGSAAVALDTVNVLCTHISVAELAKPGGGGAMMY